MRKDFKLLLAGVAVCLSIGAGLIGCAPSGDQAAPAAAGVSGTSNSNTGSPATGTAQPGGGQSRQQSGGRPTAGVVDKVGEREFSLKANSSSDPVTVRINDQTTIRKQVAGALSDIKQGERITLRGDAGADGSIAANSIQLVPDGQSANRPQAPNINRSGNGQNRGNQQDGQRGQFGGQSGNGGQGRQGVVFGTVDNISGSVITITRIGGSNDQNTPVKATVSDKTSITKTATGDFKDISAGESVMVVGPRGTDGAITASSIQILPPGASRMMGRQQ